MRISKTDREESLAILREHFKPGQTVYTVLRHVSASGMSRDISVLTVEGNETRQWDYHVSRVLGYSRGKREGLRVGGCGMDVGFAIVYELGAALWPHGTPEPHSTRNGEPDTAGGYALKHRWM